MSSVIVDTNIVFSILLGKSQRLRDVIFSEPELTFYCCRFTIIELFKHKEKIAKLSSLPEEDLLVVFYSILKRINFYDESSVTDQSLKTAYELCRDVDEKDTIFVALTIELNAQLWTGDERLKKGLRQKGFSSFFELVDEGSR